MTWNAMQGATTRSENWGNHTPVEDVKHVRCAQEFFVHLPHCFMNPSCIFNIATFTKHEINYCSGSLKLFSSGPTF